MNTIDCSRTAVLLTALFISASAPGADQISLQLQPAGSQGVVQLHSQMNLPVSSQYPEYTILHSTDLVHWTQVGSPISGSVGVSDELLRNAVPLPGQSGFYRVSATVKIAPDADRRGDAIYGYGTEFNRQLGELGQLSLEDFAAMYMPTNQYLPQITFDPTQAEFWDQFNVDPDVYNATNSTKKRLTDFRLDPNEFAIFQTNGFVVSQRMGTYSFADSFYKVFTADLPVFFSCDAALQAWHRSYLGMLEELEESSLAPSLGQVLDGMAARVPGLWNQAQGTAITNGVKDADYFIAVARSLLSGEATYGSLGQATRIQQTLNDIDALEVSDDPIFGASRTNDYSQFQVRGHYTTSTVLSNYFRAMMWCGFVDFRFTGKTNDNSLRELSGAVAMHLLLKNSGEFNDWKQMDDVIRMFVGLPDSLNFAQLSDLMAAANINSPADLATTEALQNLQAQIMAGQLGVQNIRNNYYVSPFTAEQVKLPRSFTVLGQRFTMDGWAMNQCLFDSILWDEDGIPDFGDKVPRRVASDLDIAFSVLGNDQITPEIVSRIADTNGVAFRDGLPYQHNLAAVRRTIDLQNDAAWTNTIYTLWLDCLRALSEPTTEPQFPETMRTRAWAMKTVNTQLASWTELKHDTVLYTKQPYTAAVLCSYPDGYIEPRVNFWQKMADLALRTKDLVATLPSTGQFTFEPNVTGETAFTVSIGTIYTNRLNFLDNFAAQMTTLRDISLRELNREPLTSNQVAFVQNLIENPSQYNGVRMYSGWYPQLFYNNARAQRSVYEGSDIWDAMVTDVQTDTPDVLHGDPGCVLHEAVGNVDLLMIAVDCGDGDKAVYAGPVLSHYEFQRPLGTRETDEQWKNDITSGTVPAPPEWTSSYLVPGTATLVFPPPY